MCIVNAWKRGWKGLYWRNNTAPWEMGLGDFLFHAYTFSQEFLQEKHLRASFSSGSVVKNLSMQETRVQSPGLGRSHMPRSNQAHAPHLLSLCSRAQETQLLSLSTLEPLLCNKRGHRTRSLCTTTTEELPLKRPHTKEEPAQPKINQKNI